MPEKRKSGRFQAAAPPPKKTRLSTHVKQEAIGTPEATPAPDDDPKPVLLPNRTYQSRPLPTLPELQPHASLSDEDFQSIEKSGTLAASLERSRQRWLAGEFLERYWVKPAGSKKEQLKNPTPNNPMRSWMRDVGQCTIIVEPLIFEANVYVSKDPAVLAAAQQHNAGLLGAGAPGAYAQPTVATQARGHIKTETKGASSSTSGRQQSDPVIQLLASRAASDHNLKELMKIVATGAASPEQLKTFQRYIDEIQAQVASTQPPPQPAAPPAPRPIAQTPRARIQPAFPVALEFTAPGASPDRFLFPPYSIVESLGSYSVLASFLVFRKGKDASDSSLFDPDTEYHEPITVKIDVAPNSRAVEALECMKRSVKPADEVRKWMVEQMFTKKRAETRYLPLRLPHESQIGEDEMVEEPPPPVVETKKRGPYKKKADREREREQQEAAEAAEAAAKKKAEMETKESQDVPADATGAVKVEGSTDRPRRNVKRSMRLSESQAV